MAELKRYRDKNTGLVVDLYDWQASVFPDTLVQVEDDAKPLAYTPISDEKIELLKQLDDELEETDFLSDAEDEPAANTKAKDK